MSAKRRQKRRLLLLAVVAWCTFLLGASCEDKTIYEHSGYVSGTVTDSLTGQPLDSVGITWGDTMELVPDFTDTNGAYVIQVPVSRPTVFARKEGYQTKWLELILSKSQTSGVDFQLTPN